MRTTSTHTAGVLAGAFVVALFAVAALMTAPAAQSQTTTSLGGWMWSDTIGWISLSCDHSGDTGTQAAFRKDFCQGSGNAPQITYGLSYNAAGAISGYAWSDNVGWISSSAGLCGAAPTYNTSTGAFSGFLRAINADSGWDGCISLSGTTPSGTYGVDRDIPNDDYMGNTTSSWAWGSDVVGWVAANISGTTCPAQPRQCLNSTTSQYYDTTACSWVDDLCDTGLTCQSATGQCSTGALARACFSAGVVSTAPDCANEVSQSRIGVSGTTLYWRTTGSIDSCEVTHGSVTDATGGGSGSVEILPEALEGTTVFTLTCTYEGDVVATDKVTLSFVPVYREQ